MEERLQKVEAQLLAIKERNARVEADKAWETSMFRSAVIAVITFLFTMLALFLIGDEFPVRNAVIATLGFLLSIQSLPFIKRWWLDLKARSGSVK